MKFPFEYSLDLDIPECDYYPEDFRPHLNAKIRNTSTDFTVLCSDKYPNVVQHMLAFLCQKKFTNTGTLEIRDHAIIQNPTFVAF